MRFREIIILLLFIVNILYAEKIRVTFLNPGYEEPNNPTGTFWNKVSDFMNAAADDYDIDLEIIYSNRNHLQMIRQGFEVVSRAVIPHYLIVVNEKKSAEIILESADAKGIKTFVMLNGFNDYQKESVGKPREKYKNYIGSMVSDNIKAGEMITKNLIKTIKNRYGSRKNSFLIGAIAGDHKTQASKDRIKGFKDIMRKNRDFHVTKIEFGQWNSSLAQEKTYDMIKDYPDLDGIWTANDPMAEGAIKASEELDRFPGTDIFIGGLNWDEVGIKNVFDGKQSISVGGHFMIGGFSLTLLNDYHKGLDFEDEGLEFNQNIFWVLNNSNIDSYYDIVKNNDWDRVDFNKFSKFYNKSLKKYKFSLKEIFNQLNIK